MNLKVLLLISMVFLMASSKSFAAEGDLQTLVDDLQVLAEKSRKERAADRWLQNALEDLVSKYNFPWRKRLFTDDFSDGDFTRNPKWQVSSGEFWIDRRLGLRSQVTTNIRKPEPSQPTSRQPKQDLGTALLGALLSEALGPQKRSAQPEPTTSSRYDEKEPASIRTAVNIPTTFAVESVFSQNNRPGEQGQFEWVVMQSGKADNAYKVILSTGRKATLEVMRVRGGRTSYLQSTNLAAMNDGGEHTLSWRQTSTGEISVYVDGVEVIKTTDHPFRYGFKYLAFINRVGDFSVSGVEVLGGQ